MVVGRLTVKSQFRVNRRCYYLDQAHQSILNAPMKIGASYSTVSEDELLSQVLPRYRIEEPISCVFWQRGINDTYRVRGSKAAYSLRVYRHRLRSREEIDFEIAALNYLKQKGANVAYPIATHSDEYVTEIQPPEGTRYVIVTTHAEGKEPDYDEANSACLFGESVAELHNYSNGFETPYSRPTLTLEHLLEKPLKIITPYLEDRASDSQFIKSTAEALRDEVIRRDVKKMDIGFCHGDCHGGNVHSYNNSITHFDFDCCGFGFRIFELATFKWGIHGEDNEDELWSNFLSGYQSIRQPSAEDLSLLETFVVIRHIWWMALIMGNARDFGAQATSDEFIDHQIRKIKKLLNQC